MKKGKRKRRRLKKKTLIILSVITLIALAVAAPFLFKLSGIKKEAEALVAKSSLATFKSDKTTLIYDTNGNKIANMQGTKVLYYKELKDIPKIIQDAFVVMEDRKFYSHSGVDFFAIVRAAFANYNANEIEQGASTITQQLARNIFLSQEVTMRRKIEEMYVALALERKYSKELILEFYLNNIYFANGYYGVEAAAKGYFDKSVNELSVSQMAFVAAIPNNPSKYDPLTNFEHTIARRNLVLQSMYDESMISYTDYKEALAEKIELNQPVVQKYNYVETYVKYCATLELMQDRGFVLRYEFSSEDDYNRYMDNYYNYFSKCQQELFNGGYSIYTSIDMEKQDLLQNAMDTVLSPNQSTNDEGVYKLQGAAVSVDNASGNVVAIVGGRTQELKGYSLNRAYQSYRQSGSAIKPIAVYMPFLMQGNFPSTIVVDEPIPGGPRNSDNTYVGEITLTEAISASRNTVAWKTAEMLTPRMCNSYLIKMHFKNIYMDMDNVATSIGGFTYGVTVEEMTGAYGAIENDGNFRYPTCIKKIVDVSGRTVVDTASRGESVYYPNACKMMKAILQETCELGTAGNGKLDNAVVAAKTGTTNDAKDIWFMGFTEYYTTGVWVGYDMPQGVEDGSMAAGVWKSYMEPIHEGLEKVPFEDYDHKFEDEALGKNKEEETQTQSEGETQTYPEFIPPSQQQSGGNPQEMQSQSVSDIYEIPTQPQTNPSHIEWDSNPDTSGEWDSNPNQGEQDSYITPGEQDASGGNRGEWDAG